MLRPIILCLFLAVVFGGHVVPRDVNERIMGGDVVPDDAKYPSKCVLRYIGVYHCGCIVLSDMHILTSARCARVPLTHSLSVHVGSNHIQAGGQQIDVNNKTDHPDFVYEDVFSPDISILTLLAPIALDATVGPAELPAQDAPTATDSMATIIGWGYSAYDGPLNPSLMEVEAPVTDWQKCKDFYITEGTLTDNQICTNPQGVIGPCNGDNGGPMFVDGVVHGITSWTSENCAITQGFPGLYTRVAAFRDWITQTVGV